MCVCKGCTFEYEWKQSDTSVPSECIDCQVVDGKPTNFKPKGKTYADRIRAMSDEELAHELALVAGWDRKQYRRAKQIGLEKVMLEWLKQPAMEDQNA